MIDLTPLDVRNKRGDFKKIMRGYDPQEAERFDGVPNLEEVLTESGVGEMHAPPDAEIAPPPAPDDTGQDPLAVDKNNDDKA